MKVFAQIGEGRTPIGLAFGPWVPDLLSECPDLVDYVEIAFEQLRHDPSTAAIQERIPAVLHCASLSVAGFVAPEASTVAAIEREARRMQTPWIGEHLAFITADPIESRDATALTYTVCPQLSEETIEQVVRNHAALESRFGTTPILLENSPQYFTPPGSTMSMVDFIREVFDRCQAGLLLDITHFLITALNTGVDPQTEILRLPLERVEEIHLSGLSLQSGVVWDDHARLASEEAFTLLGRVLERCRPRAVTFEYNWTPMLPAEAIGRQIARTRAMLA